MFSQPSIAKCSLGQISSVGLFAAGATRVIRDHGNSGDALWPVANRAIYVPFYLEEEVIAVSMWYTTGTGVATGNVDLGIYTRPGNKLIKSTGSTAWQVTNSILETVSFAQSAFLPPGNYWMAIAIDNISVSPSRTNFTNALNGDSSGILMEASAFPLPATATPVQQTTTFVLPTIGIFTLGIY